MKRISSEFVNCFRAVLPPHQRNPDGIERVIRQQCIGWIVKQIFDVENPGIDIDLRFDYLSRVGGVHPRDQFDFIGQRNQTESAA